MLGGDAEAEFLECVVEENFRAEEHLRALVRWGVAPSRKRGLRGGDC